MDVIFFILWGLGILLCVLIVPIGDKIEKLNDKSRLKQWWEKHIVSDNPYYKSK
jgi:hypothetical protein